MGSKLGWILAGVLLVLIVVGISLTGGFCTGLFSGPQSSIELMARGALDLHEVGVPIGEIIGSTPGGSGNAGDDYRQAADLVSQQRFAIAEAKTAVDDAKDEKLSISASSLETLEKVDSHAAAGAEKKEMKYLCVHTPKQLEISPRVNALDDLQNVAATLDALARYYIVRKEYDKGEKVLQHMFVMGAHMINERSHMDMVKRGIGVQSMALASLRFVAKQKGDTARSRAFARYDSGLSDLTDHYTFKERIIWKTRPVPRDIFRVIEEDRDKACKVQAILALGITKYTASERSDIARIKKLIAKYAADPDPVIAAAAAAARDLTKEEFYQLGTRI